ncbi:hypothetical protein AB0758_48565 [Tolypothrix bouteillei VB521301_2]|uniref:hypothetical protein n=1 Tax=Tolypothrix bouteillei TaxID=1246981 RepID=UPI0038B6581E
MKLSDSYKFLQNLTGFIRELQQLKKKIIHKAEVSGFGKHKSFIKFPKRTPPSPKRILEIIGIGIAIGMVLAIIRHIQFPLPEIYSHIAEVIAISVMVTVIQPTKGRSIVIGMAATICLCITIILSTTVKCFWEVAL